MPSEESAEEVCRKDAECAVRSAETGDSVRLQLDTSDPSLSALSPEEVEYQRMDDDRFHRVTILGDPMWHDEGELVDRIVENEHAREIEVVSS